MFKKVSQNIISKTLPSNFNEEKMIMNPIKKQENSDIIFFIFNRLKIFKRTSKKTIYNISRSLCQSIKFAFQV